jgi:hypothetical protein
MRYIGILALVFAGFLELAWATPPSGVDQKNFRDWLGGSPRPSLGIINPARLTVNHSVSFGFAGGAGQSLMQSVYATRFGYQLSNPVTLTFLLGAQNSRFGGAGLPMSYTSLLGGVALDWRPASAMSLHLEFTQSPTSSIFGTETAHFWAGPPAR